MKTLRLTILILLAFSARTALAASLHYTVSVDRENQYIEVELSATELSTEVTTFKMAVWAPGYYRIMDYPKNVVDFAAKDVVGGDLTWTKVGKTGWRVENGDRDEITISYRVYANARSVADAMVASEYAFIPTGGVLMYVDGEKEKPVTVAFRLPEDWSHISTGLDRAGGGTPNTFFARDVDTLYDCPVYMGNQRIIGFEVEGRPYELALETPEGIEKTTFVEDLKKMIATTTGMIGHVPYDHYTFLLMGRGGGGLEHLNSQACFTGGSFNFASRASYLGFLSFITHEFFHLYNVKTIRPVELGPFDYDAEVYTSGLWISEGFTVYYEPLLLRRAGLITTEEALGDMSGWLRTVENGEGKMHMSLRASSYDIWLNFFNRSANGNTRISYYDKGPILGLLMDIEIRRLTENRRSLDDVMRSLYHDFHLALGRGFTEQEFWDVCAAVAGRPLAEMRRYVDTTAPIDYAKYLGYAGLEVDMTPLAEQDGGPVVKRSWQLSEKTDCTPLQRAIREAIM
jgi:predicted metalloprotease with PDZ domain